MSSTSRVSGSRPAGAVDLVIVGAGVIGAAVAWRCAQRGLTVTLVDPDPERGAWYTAAGMLAPITELSFTESPLLGLNLDSHSRYPSFVTELTDETRLSTGYRETGTIAVGWDAADLAGLRDLHAFASHLGVKSELVTGRELRVLEPALSAGLPGALLAPDDHQVDPRLLHAALLAAGARRGVQLVRSSAEVLAVGDRCRGVRLLDGTVIAAGTVVLAAGSWSAQIAGVPAEVRPAVRPVKGQTLRVRLPASPVTRVVRGVVKGSPIYVVPRGDGRLVIGASSEEAGFDVTPRAGAVYELLRDAQSLLPDIGEATLEQVCVGLRPGSPDNAPLVGPSGLDGLVHATGHYRNGVLLTPVTADGVAALVTDGTLPEVLAPFTPARFGAAAPAHRSDAHLVDGGSRR